MSVLQQDEKRQTRRSSRAGPPARSDRRGLTICLVSEEYPPETGWGGIGTYTYNLAQGLVECGHRVHVIARGWGDDSLHDDGDLRLYRLSLPEPSWRRGTYFLNLRFYETRQILLWNLRVRQLVRQIEAEERLDVIESPEYHAQSLMLPHGGRRVPTIVKLHTPAYLCRSLNGQAVGGSRLDTWISERLEYRLARQAQLVTSPSRKLAEDVGRDWHLDSTAIRVIPNPVDQELFAPTADATSDERTVLFVGRIERRKGVETFADALPAILETVPGASARFVGNDHPSGPGGTSLSAHLRQRLRAANVRETAVQFSGAVERDSLPAIYRNAAVCVVPSLYENFPYTCLEAMASGCAVVASAVGGIPEIVTDELNGLLVPPACPEELAAAVIRLLTDLPLRRRLGAQARAAVQEHFSRRAISLQTLKAYRSVLN